MFDSIKISGAFRPSVGHSDHRLGIPTKRLAHSDHGHIFTKRLSGWGVAPVHSAEGLSDHNSPRTVQHHNEKSLCQRKHRPHAFHENLDESKMPYIKTHSPYVTISGSLCSSE